MTQRDLNPSGPGRSSWDAEGIAGCLSLGDCTPAEVGDLQRGNLV